MCKVACGVLLLSVWWFDGEHSSFFSDTRSAQVRQGVQLVRLTKKENKNAGARRRDAATQ